MTACSACGREVPDPRPLAAISGSVMGDEDSDCWYLCASCGLYTVVQWHEAFCGEETSSVRGPVDRATGDARVALIRRCDRPWDKRCRCPAHREYFGDSLD